MPSSPGPVGSTRMAFRMTIGLPRPWPGYPHHTGLISASCTSYPRFRHQLSSNPASRRAPLPRRMVPVITVHRGLPPPECTSLLDTPRMPVLRTGRIDLLGVDSQLFERLPRASGVELALAR